MTGRAGSLAEHALQRQWQRQDALPGDEARRAAALHPDDPSSPLYRAPRPREREARAERTLALFGQALRRVLPVSVVLGALTLVAAAGLAFWALGAVQGSIDALDAAVVEIQARTNSQAGAETAAVSSSEVGAAADYQTLVVDTGGRGIRLRDACAESATIGRAVPEGTPLHVVARGSGECAGWSLAETSDGTTTWVADRYLSRSDRAQASLTAPSTP